MAASTSKGDWVVAIPRNMATYSEQALTPYSPLGEGVMSLFHSWENADVAFCFWNYFYTFKTPPPQTGLYYVALAGLKLAMFSCQAGTKVTETLMPPKVWD